MILPPLTNGHILRRYKRFLADVELASGERVTAHCPNTGRMTGCWREGAPVQLSHSDNPRRKLPWTLERVDMGSGWVGVNTARVNDVVAEALEQQRIASLAGYRILRREPRLDLPGCPGSRLDIILEQGTAADVFVEVKSVTLWDGERLRFPDAPSERGRKHLQLLQQLPELGHRAVILYAVNRPEGAVFSPAETIDPDYARLLRQAQNAGVEVMAFRIEHGEESLELNPAPLVIEL